MFGLQPSAALQNAEKDMPMRSSPTPLRYTTCLQDIPNLFSQRNDRCRLRAGWAAGQAALLRWAAVPSLLSRRPALPKNGGVSLL